MIILAFPGMGKTPLARKFGSYVDLDFGHFREAFSMTKQDEAKLLKPFAKLAEKYENDGFVVLSNDPKLMDVLDVDTVYLPATPKFAAEKLNVDYQTAKNWIDDWRNQAIAHKVPVVTIRRGLDHYLQSAGKMHALKRVKQ